MESREKPPEEHEEPEDQSTPPDLEAVAGALDDTDADQYWDEAAKTGDTGPISEDTLTYDEARKRGLLPEESEE